MILKTCGVDVSFRSDKMGVVVARLGGALRYPQLL